MNYNGQRASKLNSKKKASALTRRTFLMFCAFSILVSLWIANDYQQPYLYQDLYQNFLLPAFDDEKNSKDVKEWRGATEKLCQAIVEQPSNSYDLRVQAKEILEVEALKRFELPGHGNMRGENLVEHKKYEKCRHAFIDLGTNIGDSIGYFVDGALDVCTPIWKRKFPRTRINEQFPHPHLDVADLKIQNKGIGVNPLMGMMRKYMTGVTPMLPENTCVYGMEGNPEFTERLKKLENFIMEMKPRPVRHLHIHTETVVTEDDKPTKLFLDKTSVKDNFWGSSILSSQQDAVKTAKELNGGQSITADVQGIRLTTLVKNAMLPFQADATEDDKTGGQLIIKMDVEGAEYQIIKEIASSNVLCDYINMGNKVVMIVEMHHMSITDAKERISQKSGFQQAKKKLEECGVVFGQLHAYWS
ncbi:MAG: hypothetical protein SGBAC_003220 [Bacillariaceae sp.]